MNYATIKPFDVANGPGIRVSLFVSGCNHRCKNCFNEVAWDFNYGTPFTEETIHQLIQYLEPPHIKGLSLLGGEPLEYANQLGLLPLLRKVKEKYPEKSIWCYTGFRYEEDIKHGMCQKWHETNEFLSYLDVLVDGKFIEEKKDLSLRFRGSSNQQIIDVKQSLLADELVLWDETRRN